MLMKILALGHDFIHFATSPRWHDRGNVCPSSQTPQGPDFLKEKRRNATVVQLAPYSPAVCPIAVRREPTTS